MSDITGVAGSIRASLRTVDLHDNVGESFEARAADVGVVAAVSHLLDDSNISEQVASALADALNLPLYDGVEVVERGDGWLLGSDSTLYQFNPLDESQQSSLLSRFGSRIMDLGVVPASIVRSFETSDAADDASTAPADSRISDTAIDAILLRAMRAGSSDLHFRVVGDECRVMRRLDGVLVDVKTLSIPEYNAVVVRLLARCGRSGGVISPISGGFELAVKERRIPVRLEAAPTRVSGKTRTKVVLRIMQAATSLKRLDDLGYPSSPSNPQLRRIRAMSRRPNGLFLVTGPTGSGKTTTLYSLLSAMHRDAPDRSYATAEDPAETDIPFADQMQINVDAELTFESALRSILRQDPDVVMVGEIRDQITAATAVRAGMTGHVVLSTLHTNSAPGAVPRLLDVGIEPRLLADVLIGISAQRLARRVCPHCAVSMPFEDLYSLNHESLARLPPDVSRLYANAHNSAARYEDAPKKLDTVLETGPGCLHCNNKGFSGRVIITETLPIDDRFRELIANRATRVELVKYATENLGFVDMWGHAWARIRAGEISLRSALECLEPAGFHTNQQ